MRKRICLLTVLFQLFYVVGFAAVVMMGGSGSSGSGGGGGSTFLSDSFTEASQTPLESHSPETGGTWGGDSTSLTVENDGLLRAEDNAARYAAFNSATPAANTYYVAVTGSCGDVNSTDEFGAVGRWDTSSGIDGYQCKLKGNGYLVLRAYESGTLVDLNGASGKDITSWFTASSTYTVVLSVAGNAYGDIQCGVYEGETLKDSVVASSHTVETRVGKAGIHIYQGNASITSIQAEDQ